MKATPQNQPLSQVMTKRQRLNFMRAQLENERSTFLADWRDLADNILPRRPRFLVTDVNRGGRRNHKILDGTATYAVRTLRSGMMSGITSPARPWFRLTTQDPDLAKVQRVKDWLDIVTDRMTTVFLRSNLYNALPIEYGDMGVFATAALGVEEDFDDVMRFYPFPIGSYCIANDAKGRVRVFQRTFRLTVRQLVEKFGQKDPRTGAVTWGNFSTHVRTLYEKSEYEAWVDVYHFIEPNQDYDPRRLQSKYNMPFSSTYYEAGSSSMGNQNYLNDANSSDLFLRESGYGYFPILCPRWEVNAEDAYGTSCPGVDALGDIKELQVMKKRKSSAVEKMINPALIGPSALRTARVSLLPGDVTYLDEREGQKGLRPLHEVNPPISELREDINDTRALINRGFYVDVMLMFAESDRREITATEVAERKEEKLLALGPMLEQLNQDMLDPLIDIAFQMMQRQSGRRRPLIPLPPPELAGAPLKVEYISIMAQAQKLVGASSIERFSSFVGNLAATTQRPDVLDKVNLDDLVEEYGDVLSVPTGIVRSDDDVAQIRQQRQEQQEQQLRAQAAEQATNAAKNLSSIDTSGSNGLTDLLDAAKAGQIAPQVQ